MAACNHCSFSMGYKKSKIAAYFSPTVLLLPRFLLLQFLFFCSPLPPLCLFHMDHVLIIYHSFYPPAYPHPLLPVCLPYVQLSHLKAWLGGNSPPSTSDPITLSCPSLVGCSIVPPPGLSPQHTDNPSLFAATSLSPHLLLSHKYTHIHTLTDTHSGPEACIFPLMHWCPQMLTKRDIYINKKQLRA